MRAFIIACLVAFTCAENAGYNYQLGEDGDSGIAFGGAGGDSGNGGGGSFGGSIGTSGGLGVSGSFGSSGGSSGSVGHGGSGSGNAYDSGSQNSYGDSQGELEKEYYTFSAKEDDFSEPHAVNQVANTVKQGLRVIFIKGPENKGLENAALSFAKQAGQQRTDIYVLNKQADIGDLANKINTVNKNVNSRPEVHFVKYRTQEDAANAQRVIQEQYDALGGHAQSINGGVAPVINFASQAAHSAGGGGGAGGGGSFVRTPSSNYLPASVLRRLRFRY